MEHEPNMGKVMVFKNPDPHPDAKCRHRYVAVYTASNGRRYVGQAENPNDATETAVAKRVARSN